VGHSLGRLSGSQEVDAQQQIDELVSGLEPPRPLKHGNRLCKARFLMELESLLQQRSPRTAFRFVFRRAPRSHHGA